MELMLFSLIGLGLVLLSACTVNCEDIFIPILCISLSMVTAIGIALFAFATNNPLIGILQSIVAIIQLINLVRYIYIE